MSDAQFLGIDVGGTKTAWGIFSEKGQLVSDGKMATPQDREELLNALTKIVTAQPIAAVGIGIAGTTSANHEDVIVCQHIPSLSHVELARELRERCNTLVTLDNDARCALIGEVASGAAKDHSSAVMLTLGTGVGGAVMQKGIVLPHPIDVSKEIGRIIADPTDGLVTPEGRGSIEALIGGVNLEQRFGIKLKRIAEQVRVGDENAAALWKQISYYFIQCIRAVYSAYSCKLIIIGGVGSNDLKYFLQDEPPCPVVAAKLGEMAGVYGAAALAVDLYREETVEDWD